MKIYNEEIRERLHFIDRTIFHAMHACHLDASVPRVLKEYVQQLGRKSGNAQKALLSRDERGVRDSVDDLARLSYHAQNAIGPADHMNYDVKSAVILAHIELSALRHQLDQETVPKKLFR
jgi:hypothetical protein